MFIRTEDIYSPMPKKVEELVNWFRNKGRVVVAFSGGVDSSAVAMAAKIAGAEVIAATSNSSTLPRNELKMAKKIAREIGIKHVIFKEDEFKEQKFVENPPDRCYYCRKSLIKGLREIAKKVGATCVVDGANASDASEHRPGMKAMREGGIQSPLLELGVGKDEVRKIAGYFGMSIKNKPSMACLASRIPYGEAITRKKLSMVEKAEDTLRNMGLIQFRVRCHDKTARIEVLNEDMPLIMENKKEILEKFKKIGFVYVALDLEGYRTGSMDEAL